MLIIDDIVFKLEIAGIDKLSPAIPVKDKRILRNIARLVKSAEYITESQGRLLVKILKENMEYLNFLGPDIIHTLKNPRWARPFKVYEKIRKISIKDHVSTNLMIDIEFSFDKELKKSLSKIQNELSDCSVVSEGRHFFIELTEKSLISVVDRLKKYNFEKSPEIVDLYNKIKDFNFTEIKNELDIFETKNEKLKNLVEKDIGPLDNANLLKIKDRKMLYQYTVSKNSENFEDHALAFKIADRKNTKIYLSNSHFSLTDVFQSLITLDRFPILIVLDEYSKKNCIETLKNIKNALDSISFNENVGVYFRFDNDNEGATFNKMISEYGYNKLLDDNNKISILSNGKLPKFFIKNSWYPKSVISFNNNLRSNKTSVYCNNCDLVIYYTSSQPLIGNVDAVV